MISENSEHQVSKELNHLAVGLCIGMLAGVALGSVAIGLLLGVAIGGLLDQWDEGRSE